MVRIAASEESKAHGAARPIALDAASLRDLIDHALTDLDADQGSGPLLGASGMKVRIEVTDLSMHIDVAAIEDSSGHHLRWGFADPDWEPKLSLRMDSATANAYLQGRESLAIGIARGRVRCRGESGVALAYLPLLRLIAEPYRRAVMERAPALAV